ncbi:ALPHA-MANNOSIDASE domain protein [Mycobacterium kansasii]|uniref:ALPHA-MANNOSIDASE domain protein n=1 Tax=Mycobacterium kansasii TaxID=1768 RepID=A0A1V3WHL4_MYCKA|nr:ALPHA-MANNOSIDASE domain protein [Mycobacterium kansasii]
MERRARVDCRTTVDGFTGEDRLLRLRWPCPVPGAMPVSEVGDAVVGRGFALLHSPGESGRGSVDTADHPWTLDNPAYGWFGLSSAARVRAGSDAVRAVSVAEVVSPGEKMSGPMARELMVALVRAGVTATCSGADKPRYGNLDVDSNLPDTRIALGGLTATCSPKRCWPRPTRHTPPNSSGSWPRPAEPGCGCRPRRRCRRSGCPGGPARGGRAAGVGDRRPRRRQPRRGDRLGDR